MSVYVDPLIPSRQYYDSPDHRWNWAQSCHLTADTEPELHEFAARLGLKRAWFQPKSRPHYDLTANKRKQALQLGATEATKEQMIARFRRPESEAHS